jgi:hypothetical protein
LDSEGFQKVYGNISQFGPHRAGWKPRRRQTYGMNAHLRMTAETQVRLVSNEFQSCVVVMT